MDEGQVPGSALAPQQVAARLQGQVGDGIAWARRRKARFRRSASAIRMLSLVLAVTSTIILGLQHLNFWTGLAFSLVAVGTLVSAVEPFFNWRSRWILMEEAQYKLQRIRDELDYTC
jgi:drug/metabolite transporter (DMT)-like permease